MAFIKRGLGRGLETLLADVAGLTGRQQESAELKKVDDQPAQALNKMENHNLLQEAEALRSLIDELEAIIQARLQ
ncbi:conserved hypothetical protein [Candidatus Methylobacter favarea]|uniref:Uncharacterized protein n=1 Tax=Candidatus Methylobacter favarea TaxID=2707345 RepID=A0A8S0X337_9GAMM|nr:hypothetical protein [Candidatus Methylobacter favarea]CAA9892414.1 conserved hypothetical protein [Candidatus Methylobacter favarea]